MRMSFAEQEFGHKPKRFWTIMALVQGWRTTFLSRAISNFMTFFEGHAKLLNVYITVTFIV